MDYIFNNQQLCSNGIRITKKLTEGVLLFYFYIFHVIFQQKWNGQRSVVSIKFYLWITATTWTVLGCTLHLNATTLKLIWTGLKFLILGTFFLIITKYLWCEKVLLGFKDKLQYICICLKHCCLNCDISDNLYMKLNFEKNIQVAVLHFYQSYIFFYTHNFPTTSITRISVTLTW